MNLLMCLIFPSLACKFQDVRKFALFIPMYQLSREVHGHRLRKYLLKKQMECMHRLEYRRKYLIILQVHGMFDKETFPTGSDT